jgi:hypothetical protein
VAGDLPSALDQGSTNQQYTRQSATPLRQSAWRPHMLVMIALAVTAAMATAALIVALTRPVSKPSATTTAPTYSAAEIAAAQQQLCDSYKLAARAVQVDTAGTDKALARIATTNGAVMLDNAAANPALDAKPRDAARTLAAAYLNATAMGSKDVADDAEWQAAVDDVNGKDAVMKKICSGG